MGHPCPPNQITFLFVSPPFFMFISYTNHNHVNVVFAPRPIFSYCYHDTMASLMCLRIYGCQGVITVGYRTLTHAPLPLPPWDPCMTLFSVQPHPCQFSQDARNKNPSSTTTRLIILYYLSIILFPTFMLFLIFHAPCLPFGAVCIE